MAKKTAKTYSVSQVNNLIQVALETQLPSRFTVAGEVTGFNHHFSGHCYFALKDTDKSLLNCVMWKSKFASVKFTPENGMAVLATGHIDVYSPGGKYQLYVDRLAPAGVGQLQLAFEQMVKRLRAEGLFEDAHKKLIPAYPMRIAILTSQSGAALMDIIDSIYNRWPCVKLLFYPIPVQGEGAAEKIASAIRDINRRNRTLKLDVMIVGRGGGSLEDLWAFNEESVARAIFDSKIPVIIAVGHEVDVTIADLVADTRASTPTKAGVIAVPDVSEVLASIDNAHRRLNTNIRTNLSLCKQQLNTILASSMFRSPRAALNAPIQQTDELQSRLKNSAGSTFAQLRNCLAAAQDRLRSIEPVTLLTTKRMQLNNIVGTAHIAVERILAKKRLQLTANANRLKSLNPKSVLKRGYSLTTNARTDKLITSVDDVKTGDTIVTELADGKIQSDTIKAEKKDE